MVACICVSLHIHAHLMVTHSEVIEGGVLHIALPCPFGTTALLLHGSSFAHGSTKLFICPWQY